MAEEVMDCPFCGYHADKEYIMLLHMEKFHSEGPSPFVADDEPTGSVTPTPAEEEQYASCPVDGCGEVVTLVELEDHVELHGAEEDQSESATHEDFQASGRSKGYQSPYGAINSKEDTHHNDHQYTDQVDAKNRETGSIQKWKQLLSMPAAVKGHRSDQTGANGERTRVRLGKADLGRYAHEDKMPQWLVKLLQREGQVIGGSVIPVLAQLLNQNSSTRHAYLCHQAVDHISKVKKEGGFCGYRNIQMLSSYIIGSRALGAAHFNGRLPSIFQIQDYIENAWDLGINMQGRVETGGVKNTRKYIGTPEAQAMFLGLNIPCEARGFKDPLTPGAAQANLLKHIEAYFEAGILDPRDKVHRTNLPPIYFQHRGHSLTIVGFEKRTDGTKELLVFDPMFQDPPRAIRYVSREFRHSAPDGLLKYYRRGNKYLRKFHEFEVLELLSKFPVAAAGDNGGEEMEH
ncbi:peptidase family C78-domain-containing protein [Xylariales sp. AK1849]|nr:peptidase family C78-domain-containing protein [Xylariales sp. AK1849]